VKREDLLDGAAAEVHESLGFEQNRPAFRNLRKLALPFRGGFENRTTGGSEPIQQHETYVMAGVFILFPGISEADDEGERHEESGGAGVDGCWLGQEIIVVAAVGKPIADGYSGSFVRIVPCSPRSNSISAHSSLMSVATWSAYCADKPAFDKWSNQSEIKPWFSAPSSPKPKKPGM